MRASNFYHVTATFVLLLLCVKAQESPSGITVYPPVLVTNETYTVSWKSSPADVFIGGIFLQDQPDPPSLAPNTVQIIQPSPSCSLSPCTQPTVFSAQSTAIFSLTASLDTMKSYVVEIQYATTNTISNTNIIFTATGNPLPAAPSNGGHSIGSSSDTAASSDELSGMLSSLPSSKSPTTATVTTATSPSSTASMIAGVAPSTPPTSSDSSTGLGTGAKVGIAIAAVAVFLFILIGALLCCRRRKQRQDRALSSTGPYTQDLGSTNRDFTAEKEMNVMSSPVAQFTPTNTWGSDFAGATPATQPTQTERRSQTNSWAAPEEHVAARYTDEHAGPHTEENRMSTRSPTSFTGSNTSPPSSTPAPGAVPAVSRKPVAVPVHHLHEPGMSDEEVARLEEEERRIDEAIAEAERKRELQQRNS